jgi:uncharacterized membrane protein
MCCLPISWRRRNVAKEDNSKLVAIVFEGEHTAEGMLENLRELEKRDALKLKDAVVLSRAPAGEMVLVAGQGTGAATRTSSRTAPEVDVQQTKDKRGRSVLKAGGVGLIVGTLLGGPVGGMLVGGLIGGLRDKGIDNKFVDQIKAGIKPDSSAILVLAEGKDPQQILEAIRPMKGTVLHTTLSDEMDKQLRDALRDEG